jgi:hypothetical protein
MIQPPRPFGPHPMLPNPNGLEPHFAVRAPREPLVMRLTERVTLTSTEGFGAGTATDIFPGLCHLGALRASYGNEAIDALIARGVLVEA